MSRSVGIEAISAFGGSGFIDVMELAAHRGLDMTRMANLLMCQKAVALPFEDPVTCGANAARPLIDALAADERERIELIITCSESGIDFGKSMSTYLHKHLQLKRNCRLFEIKQACYSGTAGLQMAMSFVLSQTSPGAKALVVATDIARFMIAEGGSALTADWSYAELSAGAGAVALLVSDKPRVLQLDIGANGYYGYEVMDTCRPGPDIEAGDSDLSLLSYLDCFENAFQQYCKRVSGADYAKTFQYIAFHTPFGGMIKGAHRTMMRKATGAKLTEIETDFEERVMPGLAYCQRVGNIMGATSLLSLVSTIDNGTFPTAKRIGCFSYGSGCCSEFYSGVVHPEGQAIVREQRTATALDLRWRLSMQEYDELLHANLQLKFGTRNVVLGPEFGGGTFAAGAGSSPRLILREIREFHRVYEWTDHHA